jgi:hypothetical protein
MASPNDAQSLHSLQQRFPEERVAVLKRFLWARKGNETAAAEQYANYLDWRSKTFPIPRREVDEIVQRRVFYQLPGFAVDGSSILVFDGPNHHPDIYSTEETMRAILHVAFAAYNKRDPDNWKISLVLYAPKGTPFDLKGIAALASTFGTYFPVSS